MSAGRQNKKVLSEIQTPGLSNASQKSDQRKIFIDQRLRQMLYI